MHKNVKKFLQSVIAFPVLAMSFTAAPFPGVTVGSPLAAAISPDQTRPLSSVLADNQQQLLAGQAAKIDEFLAERNSPLAGHGMVFAKSAQENGIPYNLVAAISTIESDAGLQACSTDKHNISGFKSCRGVDFSSYDEAIEMTTRTIAGKIDKSASYYEGKTLNQKLVIYNGDENPEYVRKVKFVMNQIDSITIPSDTASLNSATNTNG